MPKARLLPPPDFPVDTLYCADARCMAELPDESVQLVVTSPPYNVRKNYDNHNDDLAFSDYLAMLAQVWQECRRVLVQGGRLAVNVANTDRKPYVPLNRHIAQQMHEIGFIQRGEIIWDKAASAGISTAWGSFAKASNPVLRDVHEYILIFSKGQWQLGATHSKDSGIQNLDFVAWTRSIWRFNHGPVKTRAARLPLRWRRSIWRFGTESRVEHPAPFPVELPRRLIYLYSNRDDIVLDPFMGSGSTALAAAEAGRHYVGYDISAEYCDLAAERLQAANYRYRVSTPARFNGAWRMENGE